MIEVRFHGRGGQGVKKSAQILARAAYLSGYKTQDFALYGAERRGAPVISFTRIDKKAIKTRGYIFEPDYIVILDETISESVTLKGKKSNTRVIINTHNKVKHGCVVDATRIALEEVGTPLGANIALLGAFAHICKLISLENLEKAVITELGKYDKKLINKNIQAAKRCYDIVRCY